MAVRLDQNMCIIHLECIVVANAFGLCFASRTLPNLTHALALSEFKMYVVCTCAGSRGRKVERAMSALYKVLVPVSLIMTG